MDPQIGDACTWYDEFGKPHPALITNVHGSGPTPSINLVTVSNDPDQTDTYGRKIERQSSVTHKVNQSAHGRYWMAAYPA